jgi:hypothetical protein
MSKTFACAASTVVVFLLAVAVADPRAGAPLRLGSRGSGAADKRLRLTPMSRATEEQLRILGRAPTPFEDNWGIFVQWPELAGGLFQLSVPEGLLSLRQGSFNYVCSQRWRSDPEGGWSFDEPLRFARRHPENPFVPGKPYTIEPYVPYPARLRAEVEPFENRVELRFELINEGRETLEPQLVWICFLHGWGGPGFDRLTVPGFSRDTYFRRGGAFLPWRPQESGYRFMSAAGSALTARGWRTHAELAARGGKVIPVRPHPAAEGVRAARIETGGRPLVVALASEDAEVLGGGTGNPCTDLGLGLESLGPGRRGRVRATAWFIRGELDDLNRSLGGASR